MPDRLYFNGDSFVAGVELGDDILPDYPGLSMLSNEKSRFWYQNIADKRHKLANIEDIEKLEKERCFAGQVQNTLKLECLNRAVGGASMDRIVRTSINDLLMWKKQFPKDKIHAFLGVSVIERFEVPHGGKKWCDISTKNLLNKSVETFPLTKYKLMFETDYHAYLIFFKHIFFLKNFCKVYDIDLHWIGINTKITDMLYYNRIDNKPIPEDLSLLIENTELRFLIDMNECSRGLKEKDIPVMCPGGHFGKPVHDKVAEKIIDLMNTKG